MCRDLQPWSAEPPPSECLMPLHADGAGQWDQFAANERLYGVRTSYSEELYTTVLDPSKCACTVEEANLLAAEIMQAKQARQAHTAQVQDGLSEEDRHSAVLSAPQLAALRVLPTGSGHTSGDSTPRSATGSVLPSRQGGGKRGRNGRGGAGKSRLAPAGVR